MDYIAILAYVTMQFFVFCMGIYIGKLTNSTGIILESSKKNTNNILEKNKSIIIDDKKIVLDIKTDGLEKKFNKIAEEKSVESDIESSVSKLKSMKG